MSYNGYRTHAQKKRETFESFIHNRPEALLTKEDLLKNDIFSNEAYPVLRPIRIACKRTKVKGEEYLRAFQTWAVNLNTIAHTLECAVDAVLASEVRAQAGELYKSLQSNRK